MLFVRFGLAAASLGLVVMAAWTTHPSAGKTLGDVPDNSHSNTPTSSPSFRPGPSSVSGRVVRLTTDGAVLDSAGHEIEVSFSQVVDVWRETTVAPTAIEVGDDLFVNGTGGSPFIAAYITANIGRIDGVIREIDPLGMVVDVQLRSGGTTTRRIDFSPYIEYGYAGGPKLTRADLVVGRTIGMVVYGHAGEPLRATRIWTW